MKGLKMYGYSVVIDSTRIESYREPVEYGGRRDDYINEFSCIQKNSKSPDVVVENDIPVGETCYVVWVEYSQGDSFGWGKNNGVETVFVTTNHNVALAVRDVILSHEKSYRRNDKNPQYKNGQKIKLENDEIFNMPEYIPWCDCFERLEQVHVETAIMR